MACEELNEEQQMIRDTARRFAEEEVGPLPAPDPDDPFVVFLISPRKLRDPGTRRAIAEPFARSSDPRSDSMTIVLEESEPLTEDDVLALRDLASEAQVARIDVHASSDH